MKVIQSRSFANRAKRFSKQDKKILDEEIRKVLKDPACGQEKKGELRGVFVHKFKIHATQYLLAYRLRDEELLELVMIGPHENYYRDLEKYVKSSRS